MKYMQSGGFQKNPFMRLTLLFSLLFLTGLWITSFAMYFSRMGLAPASVASYYLGSEAEFRAPRSFESMLEVTHVHLPIMGIVVLLLTHLLIFAPFEDSTKYAFIAAAFLSALLEVGSGWLVRFVHPGFAVLKVASFLCFQAVQAFLLAALAIFLVRSAREEPQDRRRSRGPRETAHSPRD